MVVPYRNGPLYASHAEKKGVVEYVGAKAVRIDYADGTKGVVEIGTIYGKWSGKTIPHRIVTVVKQGDVLEEGDLIAYNRLFYRIDPLFPRQVALTLGRLGYFALQDRRETYEDGSMVHERFAKKMRTSSTYVRAIVVDFDLEILNLIKVGTHVDSDSILCTMHPRQSGMSSGLDERALSTLQRVNSLNPKADYDGTVEKFRVLYTGDMEFMSDSLRTIAQDSDDRLASERRQLKQPVVDGMVDVGFRSGKNVLGPNQVMIEVYITHETDFASGDKKVLGLQMKSVTGKVTNRRFETEGGAPLDGSFGGDSLERRIVDSPIRGATSNTLAIHFSKMFAQQYRKAGG
jgi:hypothetical protein